MLLNRAKNFTFSRDAEITQKVVSDFIEQHRAEVSRYTYLSKMYRGEMEIYEDEDKADWKPDNRLAVNFPKYIVDTFTGYFNGIPVKKSHQEESVLDAIQKFDDLNDMEDEESELAKMACVYGRAFELVYQNEETETGVVYNSPENMFMVYDNTIKQRPLFAIRYGYDDNNKLFGEVYTKQKIYKLDGNDSTVNLNEPERHAYNDVPVIEYYFNEERMSIFESVISLVNSFNKALSEKANDVDYFSDQYLAFIGAEIDQEDLKNVRSNRIINYFAENDKNVDVRFLDKPDSDSQTENLLNRLMQLIFQTSMVANISDESFGQASGTSLAYKLQAMSNLALSFQRKFQSALNARYKLFCSLSTNVPSSQSNAWQSIEYTFTRNEPKDIKEQAETASLLMGITSEETALSVLSVVSDVKTEVERIKEEKTSVPQFDKDIKQE